MCVAAAVHKIDLFLDTVLRPFIHSASAAQWQAWRDAAIASRQEKPKSIDERATAYWHEVAIQRWDFDGVDRDVAILKTLTVIVLICILFFNFKCIVYLA